MNTAQSYDERSLDQSLQSLVASHGYSKVMDHLARFNHSPATASEQEGFDTRYLITLSPEEREPYLKASVEMALPAYEADLALPESERQLTEDLEIGEFFDYEEEPHG